MARRNARVILSAQDRASKVILGVHRSLKGLGALAVTVGAVQVGRKMVQGMKESVKTFSEWDKQVSSTAAVLGKNRGEMALLEKQSKQLGRTTQFTARQTAEAQFLFAKAGFDTKEIYDALPGTLNLAAAAEIGIGEAADISAGLIRGFALDASQAADVADLLAVTANNANTTIPELAEGFKFAAPAARGFGISLKDTSAAMAILSDNMLGGSIGGTGLRKTLTTLLGQVNKLEGATGLGGLQTRVNELRAEGAGLEEVLDFLAESGVNAENVYKIFGDRAGNVALTLINNRDRLKELGVTLDDRFGKALDVASKKWDNLAGDTVFLNSALEGTQIIVGEKLNTGMRTLTQQATLLASAFNDSAEAGGAVSDVLMQINDFLLSLGERALTVSDVIQVAWAGLKVAFNAVAKLVVDLLNVMTGAYVKFISAINVGGIFDMQIIQLKAAKVELDSLSEGFVQSADDIWQAAVSASTGMDNLKGKLRVVREQVVENANLIAEAAKNAALEGGGKGGENTVDEVEVDVSTDEVTNAEQIAQQIRDVRMKAKEQELEQLRAFQEAETAAALASLEERHAQEIIAATEHGEDLKQLAQDQALEKAELVRALEMEKFGPEALEAEMAIMQMRHEEELLALEENEIAKTELMAIHEEERKLLKEQFAQERLAVERNMTKAEMDIEKQKAKDKQRLDGQMMKEGTQVLSKFFGSNKAFAIAEAIISTRRAYMTALAAPPGPPWTKPMAMWAAAEGLASIATIKGTKFKAQFGAVPGISAGPPGSDNLIGRFNVGEIIADTTPDEARAILGGAAAIVPFGAEGAGGGLTLIVNGDILDPEEFFSRPEIVQAMGRGRERLADDGEVI